MVRLRLSWVVAVTGSFAIGATQADDGSRARFEYQQGISAAIAERSLPDLDRATQALLSVPTLSESAKFDAIWTQFQQQKRNTVIANYLIDSLSSVRAPSDKITALIREYREGDAAPDAKAFMIRALGRAHSKRASAGSAGGDLSLADDERIVSLLRDASDSLEPRVATNAVLEFARLAPSEQAIAVVRRTYERGVLSSEHFFRESIVHLPALGEQAQRDVINSLMDAYASLSPADQTDTLPRLLAMYLTSEQRTALIRPADRERLDSWTRDAGARQ